MSLLFKGEIYIIPNSLIKFSDLRKREKKQAEYLYSEILPDDKMVQICTGSENLTCHGVHLNGHHFLPGAFSEFLPVKVLENVSEGDTLWLGTIAKDASGNEVEIEYYVEANQLRHKYKNFGAFEEVLHDLAYR